MALTVAAVRTPVGLLIVTDCPAGLCSVSFAGEKDGWKDTGVRSANLDSAIRWITDYFSGKRFDSLPDLLLCYRSCTDYQKRVYEELRKVPVGDTVSYGELSRRTSGHRNSARAVGTAMKKNPYPLIVPCHRVIKSSGELGCYSGGGKDVKAKLLSHEKALPSESIHLKTRVGV